MPVEVRMRESQEWVESGRPLMSPLYAPAPVVMSRGEGMRLYDTEGRSYLDFVAGIAVSSVGHAHPTLVARLREQVGRMIHIGNAVMSAEQVGFLERLRALSFGERFFLCNSGAESNEAAIKLARRWQRVVRGTPRFEVITFRNGFHGRTMGALSATAQPKYHAGFEPIVPGFVYAPYNDAAAVEALVGAHTAAILVEVVQGEGGVMPADRGFLEALRRISDAHGLLLVFDEVQTGTGRTGTWWGYEGTGVVPDIMTLAKGIGGGVPLGAMVTTEAVMAGFQRGSHATTYGGNPLACAAGLAVLDIIEEEGLLERVRDTGEHFRAQASSWASGRAGLGEVRGRGMLNGIEVTDGAERASAIVAAALREGLLINTAGGNVLRFVPPLIATRSDVDEALERLDRVFVTGAA